MRRGCYVLNGCAKRVAAFGEKSGYKSLGEHILVTKLINKLALRRHLETLLELRNFDYWDDEEEYIDLEEELNPLGKFHFLDVQYKPVSILSNTYDLVSKVDTLKHRLKEIMSRTNNDSIVMYTPDNRGESKSKIKNSDNMELGSKLIIQKLSRFLKVIPSSSNLSFYGSLVDNQHHYGEFKGELFKFNHNINIFIYQKTMSSYKAIVIKNGLEYFKYEDRNINPIKNSFTRCLNKLSLYYEDNIIKYVDKYIKTGIIEVEKRDLVRDSHYVALDIEAYIENNKFVPYACGFYKGSDKGNKISTFKMYSSINYSS